MRNRNWRATSRCWREAEHRWTWSVLTQLLSGSSEFLSAPLSISAGERKLRSENRGAKIAVQP